MIISDKLFFTLSHNGKLSNRTFIEARSCARLKKKCLWNKTNSAYSQGSGFCDAFRISGSALGLAIVQMTK
jgi:hypothetical protein